MISVLLAVSAAENVLSPVTTSTTDLASAVANAGLIEAVHVEAEFAGMVGGSPVHAVAAGADPTPSPSPGGFNWDQVRPDPAGMPKSGSVYTIINVLMFLAVAAAVVCALGGLIAWSGGSVLSGHATQTGKYMVARSFGVAFILSSIVALFMWLFAL